MLRLVERTLSLLILLAREKLVSSLKKRFERSNECNEQDNECRRLPTIPALAYILTHQQGFSFKKRRSRL